MKKTKISKDKLSEYASILGKKSAEVRKANGHDSEYYRQLVNKRWAKRDEQTGKKD